MLGIMLVVLAVTPPEDPAKVGMVGGASVVIPPGPRHAEDLAEALRGWRGRCFALDPVRTIGMRGGSIVGYLWRITPPPAPLPAVALGPIAAEQRLAMWTKTTLRTTGRLDPWDVDWLALQWFVANRDHRRLWSF